MKMNMRYIYILKLIAKEAMSQLKKDMASFIFKEKKYEEKNFMHRDNKRWKACNKD